MRTKVYWHRSLFRRRYSKMSRQMDGAPLTKRDMHDKVKRLLAERHQQEQAWFRDMEKHPRCGLFPSPDLHFISDKTDTIGDYKKVLAWFRSIKILNVDFHDFLKMTCDRESFDGLIRLAFSTAYSAIRHTANLDLEELVIWYYAGHGLKKSKARGAVSMPKLEKVNFDMAYNDIANDYIQKLTESGTLSTKVKGGEIFLHHLGFCGLAGLLKPWIAALVSKSQNAPNQSTEENPKKKKHLLIILDSCYSGVLAQDLDALKKTKGPWNENDCSVTIQTACGPDERTCGGYFTPCFAFLNQNTEKLESLKQTWDNMDSDEKTEFQDNILPSPMLTTTGKLLDGQEGEPYVTMKVQNCQFHLFKDPGFFKFCSIKCFEEEDDIPSRVLNGNAAANFMNKIHDESSKIKVLDYKLRTIDNGTPMGLFLFEDLDNNEYAVCAHVHFECNNTSQVKRINLVHHKVPPMKSVLYFESCEYEEDHDGLSKNQVKKGKQKIKYAMVPNQVDARGGDVSHWLAWSWRTGIPDEFIWPIEGEQKKKIEMEVRQASKLLEACHDFVEDKEEGRWNDVSTWNMAPHDLGMMELFRQQQRSVEISKYLEEISHETEALSD